MEGDTELNAKTGCLGLVFRSSLLPRVCLNLLGRQQPIIGEMELSVACGTRLNTKQEANGMRRQRKGFGDPGSNVSNPEGVWGSNYSGLLHECPRIGKGVTSRDGR
jgi:hypothetical protein